MNKDVVIWVVDDDERVRIALARRLAASPVPPPIVFLTAQGDVPAAAEALAVGAVDFLEKPVRDQTLLEALGRAPARSREWMVRLHSPGKPQDRSEKFIPSAKCFA